ncbi:unnamed protein product [Mesocestoides corti]|uniref:PID domain-containing protein n=1 Tax=Mesocestoides corti TaxID=53468 RepID=A0A0R3UPV2_MESCO|nr:unnamed protein product [Mesocestoides corti]
MLNYECDRKNVVVTIKTRDVEKKIGFKCHSRAEAVQLFRRLKEASRFYKSTDSVASESSVGFSQTCQVTKIPARSRLQRFFALSIPEMHCNNQTGVACEDFPTPTNDHSCSPNGLPSVPMILVQPPEPDDGSKTPTADHGLTKPVESSSQEPTGSLSATLLSTNEMHDAPSDATKPGDLNREVAFEVKATQDARVETGDGKSNLPGTQPTCSPNSSSHDNFTSVYTPFGDATKMRFFSDLENDRVGLGVLDFKVSTYMTSITIPQTGTSKGVDQP